MRERGSPCLTPLLNWKILLGMTFSNTEEVLEEKIIFIQHPSKAKAPSLQNRTDGIVLNRMKSFFKIKFYN